MFTDKTKVLFREVEWRSGESKRCLGLNPTCGMPYLGCVVVGSRLAPIVFSLFTQIFLSPTSIHLTRIEDPHEPANKTVSKGLTYQAHSLVNPNVLISETKTKDTRQKVLTDKIRSMREWWKCAIRPCHLLEPYQLPASVCLLLQWLVVNWYDEQTTRWFDKRSLPT